MTLEILDEDIAYFTEKHFQLFLDAIPKCRHFGSTLGPRTKYTAYQWQVYFVVLYYCAIRLAETRRLYQNDFDLVRKLLLVPNIKEGYNKTTIAPPAVEHLRNYFGQVKESDILFPMDRTRAWQITKEAGKIAQIRYFEIMENQEIDGLYTYLFKHAYEQRMEELDCRDTLISMKLRHKPAGKLASRNTQRYGMRWRRLLTWERENITETIRLIQ